MDWKTPPSPNRANQATKKHRADVIVVGLGYAGSAALRAARETGASVIGLEAQEEKGYRLFGRDVGHINSTFLHSRGVPPVKPEELFEEWMRRASNRANPLLVRQFCEKSGEAFDWYTDMYGLEGLEDVHVAFWPEGAENFKRSVQTGENYVNGYRFWYGTAEFPDPMGWPGNPTLPQCAMANLKKAEQRGATLCFGMAAEQLLRADGRIAGVLARDQAGAYHCFEAERAVILAAGDFSGNQEMLRELCTDLDDLWPKQVRIPSMGRDGTGVQMGVWAGGKLEARPIPLMGGNGLVVMGMCNFGSVWFDQNGNRFCNEVFGGPELAGFSGNQCGGKELFAVFDEHALEHELTWAVPAHGGFDANIEGLTDNLRALTRYAYAGGAQPFSAKLKMPLGHQEAYYGRTPEELAYHAGLDEAAGRSLCSGIRRYNEMAEQGVDRDFGRDPKTLDPLTDMLFLQRVRVNSLGPVMVTVGGLLTDGQQRVLDQDYRPIDGLYATGNCCGRRYGTQYSTPISGVSIGMAITLGKEAGAAAGQ